MPSKRRQVLYRPDDEEETILDRFRRETGLSATRVIGTALRQMAQLGIRIDLAPPSPMGRPKKKEGDE